MRTACHHLMRRILALMLVLLVCSVVQAEKDYEAAFEEANRLYETGEFRRAAVEYERLWRAGANSPALHFNLGNARFRLGEMGKAIWHYRVAERMNPRDPDIQANLRFARRQTQGDAPGDETPFMGMLSSLRINELTLLLMFLSWTWIGILIVRQLHPSRRYPSRRAATVLGVLVVLTALWLAFRWQTRFGTTEVVVIAPEAVARLGPVEASQSAFTLRDGAELTVLNRKEDWVQVRDSLGRTGWIHQRNLAEIPVS